LAVALHVVVGDLVGDALVAQYADEPIEQRDRVPVANGRINPFGFERFPGIVDERWRASDAANPQNQPSRMVEGRPAFSPGAARQIWELDLARVHRSQIIATSLRWASLSPSMYRWVVWIDR
jgi:hypothetical protein